MAQALTLFALVAGALFAAASASLLRAALRLQLQGKTDDWE